MKKPPLRRLILAFSPLLGLAACTAGGTYPSLAPRAVEKMDSDAPAPAPAPLPTGPVAGDPALAARLTALAADARQGQAKFEAELPAARAAAGRAGAAATESWIEAQRALSSLEATRVLSVTALAELDTLNVARAEGDFATKAADLAAIDAAIALVQALVEKQQAEIDRLRGALSPL